MTDAPSVMTVVSGTTSLFGVCSTPTYRKEDGEYSDGVDVGEQAGHLGSNANAGDSYGSVTRRR
ncbi:hypothetical protein HanIR_Chr14g0717121 [Helianthus annuus]|nr:hypothetical protein HanIR_Chr14g0717121 [Helianthus annuus]